MYAHYISLHLYEKKMYSSINQHRANCNEFLIKQSFVWLGNNVSRIRYSLIRQLFHSINFKSWLRVLSNPYNTCNGRSLFSKILSQKRSLLRKERALRNWLPYSIAHAVAVAEQTDKVCVLLPLSNDDARVCRTSTFVKVCAL